jgi:hypothetical protein
MLSLPNITVLENTHQAYRYLSVILYVNSARLSCQSPHKDIILLQEKLLRNFHINISSFPHQLDGLMIPIGSRDIS